MSSISLAPSSLGEPLLPATPAPAARPPRRGLPYRLWRGCTGLLLILFTVASVSGMVLVIHEHLGFAPVLSPSMEPTYGPGALVITRPELASHIKVGQIVALPIPNEPGQHYVHRVISVSMKNGRPLVHTKGDANPAPEAFSLRITSKYVPQVVATVPKVGRLSVVMQRNGLRLGVLGITLLFGLVAARRLFLGLRHPHNHNVEDN